MSRERSIMKPGEAAGSLAYRMIQKFEEGYKPTEGPMDGPNIWRPMSGDRIA